MPDPVTGIIGGSAVIGGAGSIYGAKKQSDAMNNATDAQSQSAAQQMQLQKEMYDQQRADFEPYRQVGVDNLPAFQKAVDTKFQYNPNAPSKGTEWQIQQNTKDLNRQLAARGLLGGGNAAQRLSDMSSKIYAADENNQYNRQFNEYTNSYGKLLDSLKVGQGAASSAGAASQNMANQGSATLQNLGNGLSSAAIQQGNNQASLYSGLGAIPANTAALGIKAYNSGMFSGGGTDWNASSGAVAGYDPNTVYAGSSAGPWAAGV